MLTLKVLFHLVVSALIVSADGESGYKRDFEVAEAPQFYNSDDRNDKLTRVVQPIHRVPRPMPRPIPIRPIPAENAEPSAQESNDEPSGPGQIQEQPAPVEEPSVPVSTVNPYKPPQVPQRQYLPAQPSQPRSRPNYQRPNLGNRPIFNNRPINRPPAQVMPNNVVSRSDPALRPSSESWSRPSYQRPILSARPAPRPITQGIVQTPEPIVPVESMTNPENKEGNIAQSIPQEKEVITSAPLEVAPTSSRPYLQRPFMFARPIPRPISSGIIAPPATNPPAIIETSSIDIEPKPEEEVSTSTPVIEIQEKNDVIIENPPEETWSKPISQRPVFSANPNSASNDLVTPQISTEASASTPLPEVIENEPAESLSSTVPDVEPNLEVTLPPTTAAPLLIPSSQSSSPDRKLFLSSRPSSSPVTQGIISQPQGYFESENNAPNSDLTPIPEETQSDIIVTEMPVESKTIKIEPASTTSIPLPQEPLVVMPRPIPPTSPLPSGSSDNLRYWKSNSAVPQYSKSVGGIRHPTIQEEEEPVPVLKPIPSILKPKPIPKPSSRTAPTSGNVMNMACETENGYFARQDCDSYIECKKNFAVEYTCPDGLHFNPKAVWPEYPCAYPSEVKCSGNSYEQPANPTAECPRQYGFFPAYEDCTRYISCQEGLATVMNCPPGLVFNPEVSACDWPEQVPSCKPGVFQGFTCPPAPLDGDGNPWDIIINYKYGNSCKNYIACQRGSPRLLSCDAGNAFDEISGYCIESDYVKNCSEYA